MAGRGYRVTPITGKLPSEITVIGGGIIGLAIGYQLIQRGVKIRLLEKESRVGMHQSSHNSGVLHAGLYYKPGSLKAQLATRGIRLMTTFCAENNIPYDICGKLVVATDEAEIPRLRELLNRGTQNGLRDLRWLESPALNEIEPHVSGIAAVHVPEEGIVDYGKVCQELVKKITDLGGKVINNAQVTALEEKPAGWRIKSTFDDFETPFIINAAGLHCDRVYQLSGGKSSAKILPFRGEYYRLRTEKESLVRNLIYPVPDPAFPFLGVHFTRLIGGGVEAGPNAVLAFAREGYRKTDFNPRDLWESLTFPGLYKFLKKYPQMCGHEFLQSLSKTRFCRSLQRLIPEIRKEDLGTGGAGVRAQAIDADGTLLQDFRFGYGQNALHLLNAPSPGATASLAIGEVVMQEIAERY
jgi:L-2-hydroxyglutarate oxidase